MSRNACTRVKTYSEHPFPRIFFGGYFLSKKYSISVPLFFSPLVFCDLFITSANSTLARDTVRADYIKRIFGCARSNFGGTTFRAKYQQSPVIDHRSSRSFWTIRWRVSSQQEKLKFELKRNPGPDIWGNLPCRMTVHLLSRTVFDDIWTLIYVMYVTAEIRHSRLPL